MKKRKKDLLAYCGLYCGDCGGFSGEIAEAAINLNKKLIEYKFELTAKYLFPEKLKEYDKLAVAYYKKGRLKEAKALWEKLVEEEDINIYPLWY